MSYSFHEYGKENPTSVIFIHGAGVAGWMWKKQIQELEKHYHCIVPDLPDHGRTAEIPFTTLEEVADQLLGMIDTCAHGGKAVVVGHSLGAKVVTFMLAREQGQIVSAVIASALFKRMPMVDLFSCQPMIKLMWACSRNKWLMAQQEKYNRFEDPQMEADAREETARTTADAMYRYMRAFTSEMEIPETLTNQTKPVLLVYAGGDGKQMRQSIQAFQKLNPNWPALCIPKASHLYPIQNPDLFNGLLQNWLEGKLLELPETKIEQAAWEAKG